jgi:hypothetical protein
VNEWALVAVAKGAPLVVFSSERLFSLTKQNIIKIKQNYIRT